MPLQKTAGGDLLKCPDGKLMNSCGCPSVPPVICSCIFPSPVPSGPDAGGGVWNTYAYFPPDPYGCTPVVTQVGGGAWSTFGYSIDYALGIINMGGCADKHTSGEGARSFVINISFPAQPGSSECNMTVTQGACSDDYPDCMLFASCCNPCGPGYTFYPCASYPDPVCVPD